MNERFPVTPRAIIIGLIGAAAACFIVCWAELVVSSIQIAICQFAPAAIGLLLLVVAANSVFRRWMKPFALRPQEIITIYIMILVAALTTSRGLLERWFSTMVAINYYATPANHWETTFFSHIPQWAVPWDVRGGAQDELVKTFYEGLRPGAPIPWAQWMPSIGAWLIIIVSMLLSYAFLATILRRQWIDNEKLSFPLVNLPIELARGESEGKSFFANKMLWIGFTIPTFVFLLNGLHGLYPQVPMIKLELPIGQFFGGLGRPWSDGGFTSAYSSMAAVGFSYFLPAEMLMSMWAFYLISRFQNMIFSVFGAAPEAMPLYPTTLWNGYQIMGAYLVLVFYFIKSAMPHLRKVWAIAMNREQDHEIGREFVPYRWAVIGLGITTLVSVIWFSKLGMSPWMAALEVIMFVFVIVVVMARSVNEAGMLMTETSFRPADFVRLFMRTSSLGPSNLTALSLADATFTRDLRGNLLSTFLDGLKMADLIKLDRRHLFGAIAGALFVTLTFGSYLHLLIPYQRGAITLYGYAYQWNAFAAFQHFQPAIESAGTYDFRLPIYFGSGVLAAIGLSIMRSRYAWWPLAPLGFALSGSWSMIVFWFPTLIAWILKSTILRYGGMKTYTNLKPLFLGLILGEFSQAVIWATLASIWRLPAPFFPWP